MHSLIKKRAQQRKLEKEKAEKAQLLAEAWIGGSQPESGNIQYTGTDIARDSQLRGSIEVSLITAKISDVKFESDAIT